jgi:hypothetical protein
MEKLAKLNPKIMGWNQRTDGHSIGHLTGEEIAAALGSIRTDDAPSILMRAKYCHDPKELRKLIARVKGTLITTFDVPESMLTPMAMLVCEEIILPPLCPVCKGRKEHITQHLKVVCNNCGGSGYVRKSDGYMASHLNITVSEWRNAHLKTFTSCCDILYGWEHEGRKAILNYLLFS